MTGPTPPPPVPVADALDAAVEVLAGGGLAVIPTDTVYGLAARAENAAATAALFVRKGREAAVPVAVLCADADQAFALVEAVPEVARELAERHWPGPLTLVLPRRRGLTWNLGEPAATIGLRCPDHDFVRGLARAVGPLATTSANRHGHATPPTAVAAAADLLGPVDIVVDGGALDGVASTVVDLTGAEPVVLRQGALTL